MIDDDLWLQDDAPPWRVTWARLGLPTTHRLPWLIGLTVTMAALVALLM